MNLMNFSAKGLLLALPLVFGCALTACSDSDSGTDPGSSQNGSSGNDKDAQYEAEMEKLQKKMEDLRKLELEVDKGRCENEGEKKTVTLGDKQLTATCVEEFWDMSEFEAYEQELKDEYEALTLKYLAGDVYEGTGCKFKVEDKVWSYTIVGSLEDVRTTTTWSLDFEKGTLTENSVMYVESTPVCSESSYPSTEETYCKDGKMYSVEVDDYDTYEKTREDAFNEFMKECEKANSALNEDASK